MDDYLTCDECGHAVERHTRFSCLGADGCTCPVTFTVRQIEALRAAAGLPRRWNRASI